MIHDLPVRVCVGSVWAVRTFPDGSVLDDMIAALWDARRRGIRGACEFRVSNRAYTAIIAATADNLDAALAVDWTERMSGLTFRGVPVVPDASVAWIDLHATVTR